MNNDLRITLEEKVSSSYCLQNYFTRRDLVSNIASVEIERQILYLQASQAKIKKSIIFQRKYKILINNWVHIIRIPIGREYSSTISFMRDKVLNTKIDELTQRLQNLASFLLSQMIQRK